MDSTNVLQRKRLPPLRPTLPLWLVLASSVILPGLGHLLLGKKQLGTGLILASLLLCGALFGATLLGSGHLVWLILRLGLVAFLFAVTDAPLASIEWRDRRESEGMPRQAGFLNLAAYGLGYWQLGLRRPAMVAGAGGALLHLGASWWGVVPTVLSELVVAGLGYHAYLTAQSRQRRPFTPGQVRIDTTPSWLVAGLALHAGAVVLLVVAGQAMTSLFLSGQVVDQQRAIVVEPYYRNPAYGISVEMNAPGWSFGVPAPHEFLVARHVAEDTSIRVTTRSRFPGFQRSENFAQLALGEAYERGYTLRVIHADEVRLGKTKGYEVFAEGRRHGHPRRLAILTAGHGWRQVTVWFEWSPEHEAFARQELDYLRENLALEG